MSCSSAGASLSRSVLTFALIFIVASCGGGSNSSSSSQPNPQSSLGSAIDSIAASEMAKSGVPGMTVAIAKGTTILYAHAYGVADLSTKVPTQIADVFEIGSITKQFTAVLIMKLQEQGKLHVDDKLVDYLPGYGFDSAITLRMMLTHTSGLADFTNFTDFGHWVRDGISEPAALTEIGQAGLQFTPGSQYQYSNSNFYLLGSIIEKLTGQTYAADLQQELFEPLKLQTTFYQIPPANISATGYRQSGSTVVPAVIWNRSAAFAAGALSSNIYDLLTWDNALLSGKLVSSASFQQMTTSNGFTQNGFTYGFGLALSTFNNRHLMWHSGQIGGFTTENAVFLDNGFTVIILTNDQDYDTDAFVFKVFNEVCNSSQLASNC